MRFAIDIPTFGDLADARVIGELAAAAETGGWDGFFIWDHIGLDFETEYKKAWGVD